MTVTDNASGARTYDPAADYIDPAQLTPDQLRAEVWFWRGHAARELNRLMKELGLTVDQRDRTALASRASAWASMLEGALTGDDIDKCGLCNAVLVPGQPALREVDCGDVHASCLGAHLGEGEEQPGDQYQLDPEGVVDDDDEPVTDGDGILTSHAVRPHFDIAAIGALLQWARLTAVGVAQPTAEASS